MPPSANGTSTAPPAPRLLKLGALLDELHTDAAAAHEAFSTGRPRGPVTGFGRLDREIGGALEPGLHVLHGSPGTGKTALALQIAATCQFPAIYVSAEMAALELLRRITARTTETYLGRLKSGEMHPDGATALARKAIAAVPNLVLADATMAFAVPRWIQDAAEVTRGEAANVLIVIDSVHSWAEAAPGDLDEYSALNAGLAALRGIAGALGCPVLAIAERNRASMKGGGLSASSGSRKFEYGASSVIDLGRDLEKPPDATGEVEVTLGLAKNRSGSAGKKVTLRFNGALQKFREAN